MRRVLAARAIVCGLAAVLTTGCSAVAGLVVLCIAFPDEGKGGGATFEHQNNALRSSGQDLADNRDYERALETFQYVIEADPDDPAAYRLAATTLWMRLLSEQGAVIAEDYLRQAPAGRQKPLPSRELDALLRDYLARAVKLAEKRANASNADSEALYEAGAAYALRAIYLATVEGNMSKSLRDAKRAYKASQRALELDRNRKDAGLIVGAYRYAVSTLQPPTDFTGFEGGRERSIQMIEDAVLYRSDLQTNAHLLLIAIYNREGRYAEALGVIRKLQQRFPRNHLLWLEAGNTQLRAGQALEARRSLEAGLAKLPNAGLLPFGELARWRYYLGKSLVELKQTARAGDELRSALKAPARPWVHGRVHIELGKIADLAGNRAGAIQEYEEAARLCAGDGDEAGAREARMLAKEGYLKESLASRARASTRSAVCDPSVSAS
jgi:tetratricopeptide (TPR) repeat protein